MTTWEDRNNEAIHSQCLDCDCSQKRSSKQEQEKENNNMITLLVWEEVPEDTKMYLIPNEVANKYRHFLNAAHNRFINRDDMNEGMRFLNNAVISPTKVSIKKWDEGEFNQYRGCLCEYEVKMEDDKPILDTYVTSVYFSGFVL